MKNTENIIIEDNNPNAILLNEKLLDEPNNAIDKISTDVVKVNEIFNDLALLVCEQGTHLDNIEYNINNSATNIEKGKNIIVKIDKTDKKKSKCLCNTIYFCIILNLIFLCILIIKLK